MTSLIESGVIVDPSTLQDPDVEDGSPAADPASEAVVAALIESGVLVDSDDTILVHQEDSPAPVTAAPDADEETTVEQPSLAPDVKIATAIDEESKVLAAESEDQLDATHVEFDATVSASEDVAFDPNPPTETLLATAQSAPERPRSPWTPSYSVTTQGWVSSEDTPAPTAQEISPIEQGNFIEPVADAPALDSLVLPPRASSPWTPSYSVSVQGSPLPVPTELMNAEPQGDDLVDTPKPTSAAEESTEVAADPIAAPEESNSEKPPEELKPENIPESVRVFEAALIETEPPFTDDTSVGPLIEETKVVVPEAVPTLEATDAASEEASFSDDTSLEAAPVEETEVVVPEPIVTPPEDNVSVLVPEPDTPAPAPSVEFQTAPNAEEAPTDNTVVIPAADEAQTVVEMAESGFVEESNIVPETLDTADVAGNEVSADVSHPAEPVSEVQEAASADTDEAPIVEAGDQVAEAGGEADVTSTGAEAVLDAKAVGEISDVFVVTEPTPAEIEADAVEDIGVANSASAVVVDAPLEPSNVVADLSSTRPVGAENATALGLEIIEPTAEVTPVREVVGDDVPSVPETAALGELSETQEEGVSSSPPAEPTVQDPIVEPESPPPNELAPSVEEPIIEIPQPGEVTEPSSVAETTAPEEPSELQDGPPAELAVNDVALETIPPVELTHSVEEPVVEITPTEVAADEIPSVPGTTAPEEPSEPLEEVEHPSPPAEPVVEDAVVASESLPPVEVPPVEEPTPTEEVVDEILSVAETTGASEPQEVVVHPSPPAESVAEDAVVASDSLPPVELTPSIEEPAVNITPTEEIPSVAETTGASEPQEVVLHPSPPTEPTMEDVVVASESLPPVEVTPVEEPAPIEEVVSEIPSESPPPVKVTPVEEPAPTEEVVEEIFSVAETTGASEPQEVVVHPTPPAEPAVEDAVVASESLPPVEVTPVEEPAPTEEVVDEILSVAETTGASEPQEAVVHLPPPAEPAVEDAVVASESLPPVEVTPVEEPAPTEEVVDEIPSVADTTGASEPPEVVVHPPPPAEPAVEVPIVTSESLPAFEATPSVDEPVVKISSAKDAVDETTNVTETAEVPESQEASIEDPIAKIEAADKIPSDAEITALDEPSEPQEEVVGPSPVAAEPIIEVPIVASESLPPLETTPSLEAPVIQITPAEEIVDEAPALAETANVPESQEPEVLSDVKSEPPLAVKSFAADETPHVEVVEGEGSESVPVALLSGEEVSSLDHEKPSVVEVREVAEEPISSPEITTVQAPTVESAAADLKEEPLVDKVAVNESISAPEPEQFASITAETAQEAVYTAADQVVNATADDSEGLPVPAVNKVADPVEDIPHPTTNDLADPAPQDSVPTLKEEESSLDGGVEAVAVGSESVVDSVSAPVQEVPVDNSPPGTLDAVSEPFEDKVADLIPEPIPTASAEDPVSDSSQTPATEEERTEITSTIEQEPVARTVIETDPVAQEAVPAVDDVAKPELAHAPAAAAHDHASGTDTPIPAVDVEVDISSPADPSEPANEETPVASVVPLPTEVQPQAFPLMLDVSNSAESDDGHASSLDAPPISPRSRLESTASSMFFPGGWFSKMPEGRASLDVAQGEFAKPTSPSVSSPTTETEQSEEKKGKWCVVM
ncbi:hypothetical protein FB451DRAFT_257411 [Mycena latifolia]|nr:hypothetical protein FB451DRAFT_257411 [Mycena latifolia]